VTGASLSDQAAALLGAVRARRPLVHLFANFVTMQMVAGITRAVGALPVMALSREDAEQTAARADALVLSLGTPTPERLEAMRAAGLRAASRDIPVVLDPVGAGATEFRDAAVRRLLDSVPVAVIRANRGEAAALVGRPGRVRGVESDTRADDDGATLAAALAAAYGCVAAVTGPEDYVAGPARLVRIEHGHPWLAAISGAGCMVTALMGAFCAVTADRFAAAASTLACFGLAAEEAARHAAGPGTMIPALIDAVYHLDPAQVRTAPRLKEL
jgi:hydroxyethylthiazole kinase